MRFFVLLIVLAFPIADLLATVRFARWTGVPTFVLLLGSALVGMMLLRHERNGFRARSLGALRGDQPLMRGLVDSGRKVLAAMLLILPGILSDLLAVALLLLPINVGTRLAAHSAAFGRGFGRDAGRPLGDTLEGEYRRYD